MKNLTEVAQPRPIPPTEDELWEDKRRRLVEAGMVPGAVVRSGLTWAVLVHVHLRGNPSLPSAAFGAPRILPAAATVVLLQEPGAWPRLATVRTDGLLSHSWTLVG